MNPLKYLNGYSLDIQQQVQQHLDAGTLPKLLLKRHPVIHSVRSDKALYDYTQTIKNQFLRQSSPLSKVIFDDKINISHHALGLHSYVARVQGNKIKAKNEIRISSRLKRVPEPLLRMVVVHELAHLKEKDHNKAFYNLCTHMEPDYHQFEFDLRLLLTCIDANISPYSTDKVDT
ncbi:MULTISPECIES: M48 family metallopeptidase [Shewanella]|jgi:predicted metal-dependent hydrolase|uniref:M48 family metallopeptidase n=1 Tax=Shewanella oncorhynchi TaxID=2726434 RepID=A0AA50KAR1_9GAMM|nr:MULTISPECIES: M48 family metallopeptidase [Shewanella]MBP8118220.1 M48 family metallopeptidase [Shewanella sp.]AVI68499.1 metal-dependent hydrolase [Shewanella sp. WE21]MBW3515502.1 M48 family metallopeptidase [Shewanella sp. NKUCC01_JLK]MCU8009364.1 M48 family metallopeptidase [Shewanella sp. SM87]MCU8011957.1 M48 family metallopeptidase [Shewanella sp. SM74]